MALRKKALLTSLATLPLLIAGGAHAQIGLETDGDIGVDIDDSLDVDVETASESDLTLDDELANINSRLSTRAYARADGNGDGYLDQQEYRSYFDARALNNQYAAVSDEGRYDFYYDNADTDGDDLLSAEEFRESHRMVIDTGAGMNDPEPTADIANNANLDAQPLGTGNVTNDSDLETTAEAMLAGDADNDGYYSREEYAAYVDARANAGTDAFSGIQQRGDYAVSFEGMDSNDDGRLTEAEIDARLSQMTDATYDNEVEIPAD